MSGHAIPVEVRVMPPKTWPEDRYPTANEWVEWFDAASTKQRLAIAERVMDLTSRGAQCFEQNHRDRLTVLESAVERVRRRHPRGDEESTFLTPGLWCPTCGHERKDNGYGGCPERQALIIPGYPIRGAWPTTEPTEETL